MNQRAARRTTVRSSSRPTNGMTSGRGKDDVADRAHEERFRQDRDPRIAEEPPVESHEARQVEQDLPDAGPLGPDAVTRIGLHCLRG
jgi:hypothetical protein